MLKRKHNSIIRFLIIVLLVLAVYKFFTGNYLGSDVGIIDGGTGGGGTTQNSNTNNNSSNNQPEIPAREKLKLISAVDNAIYEEIMAFDFFNKDNCESYEDWQFISNDAISVYGSSYPFTSFYAKINGYHTVLLLNGSITSDEKVFFATDWNNYNFMSSPKSNELYIFEYDLENTSYFMKLGESYYSNSVFVGEQDIDSTNFKDFLEIKGISLDKTVSFDFKSIEGIYAPIFKLVNNHIKSNLEIDGVTYNDFINFDFQEINNNFAYTDFTYINEFTAVGVLNQIYSIKINGYLVYISLANITYSTEDGGTSSITDFYEFSKYDWENYDFSLGSNNKILIIDPDNTLDGKYYLNSSGEITSLAKFPANYFTQDNYPFRYVDELKNDSRNSYLFTLSNFNTIIYSLEESSTMSLRNNQQEEPSTTCSQVGNYEVCDEYEEDDYGYEWGPMHWPEEEE